MLRSIQGPLLGAMLGLFAHDLRAAQSIDLPNASFESPTTTFVSTRVDSWQKTPKPDWYQEGGGFLWDQLSGLFKNTAPGNSDHIDNIVGSQALYVFAVPEAGLFQDYDTVDWNDPEPGHAFDATFEPGKSYRLSAGIVGGGGGMVEGVSLELSLYFRDDASNRVTVASTRVVHGLATFPTNTHLVEFQVEVPRVTATDPWVGRHIGVQILSTVDTNLQGGYWDLDNLRLTSASAPILASPANVGAAFQFQIQSEPGARLEIYATTDIALPFGQWTGVTTLTNESGSIPFSLPITNGAAQLFYRVKELP